MEGGVDDEVGGDGLLSLSPIPAVCRRTSSVTYSRSLIPLILSELALFRESGVDIQRLRIPDLILEENHVFYRLMDVITEFNLQELDLMIHNSRDKVELPQSIFNCGSLVSLKLHIRYNCVLKQHTFPGLSRLKSLDLCFDKFMDSLSIGNFVSSCPLLENLTVHGYKFGDDNIIDITSASLKNLNLILPMIWVVPNTRRYELNVACPNLVSLKVFNLELPKFSFQEFVPGLGYRVSFIPS
ncbi:hypothetical protein Ddye_027365 [Dipteronia dyeriana]|uniref:F-box/LRR-repeat protein 15/At3g58940/PEG3-like LRR domain-containing protein n=1 Tax=Dipteronia dyeriana TaxID=168575 RepID=A0AAD9WRE6_9ROSI|nr:hypothetical protein Ddye_027365 [Dipteronia dyeriana]